MRGEELIRDIHRWIAAATGGAWVTVNGPTDGPRTLKICGTGSLVQVYVDVDGYGEINPKGLPYSRHRSGGEPITYTALVGFLEHYKLEPSPGLRAAAALEAKP